MGYFKCIRCGGRDTYKSLETVGFSAISVDTPGPVDHTLVNANKKEITRCRACGEKAEYIMSSAEAEREKRIIRYILFVGLPLGLVGAWIFMDLAGLF